MFFFLPFLSLPMSFSSSFHFSFSLFPSCVWNIHTHTHSSSQFSSFSFILSPFSPSISPFLQDCEGGRVWLGQRWKVVCCLPSASLFPLFISQKELQQTEPMVWGQRTDGFVGSEELRFVGHDSILFCYFVRTFCGQRFLKWTRVQNIF